MLHDNEVILDQVNYQALLYEAIMLDAMRETKRGHELTLQEQVRRQGFVNVI